MCVTLIYKTHTVHLTLCNFRSNFTRLTKHCSIQFKWAYLFDLIHWMCAYVFHAEYAKMQFFPHVLWTGSVISLHRTLCVHKRAGFLLIELSSFLSCNLFSVFWSWSCWFCGLFFFLLECESRLSFEVLQRFHLIWGELIRMYTYHEIRIDDMLLFYLSIIKVNSREKLGLLLVLLVCLLAGMNDTLNDSNEMILFSIEFCTARNTTSRKFHLIVNVLYRNRIRLASGWAVGLLILLDPSLCMEHTFVCVYLYGNGRKCRWYKCNQVNVVNFSTKTYFHRQ